jgi:hypothetical protein
MDDNGIAIFGLIVLGLAVVVAGGHMSQIAGNIVSAACGSLGTLLTAKMLQK